MTKKPHPCESLSIGALCLWAHHHYADGVPLEILQESGAHRLQTIREEKPKHERATRLSAMRPFVGALPEPCQKAYAECQKANAEWQKADAEWQKAYAERQKAYAERQKAYAERQKANAEWQKADAEWQKAYAECQKADAAFRTALVANRAEVMALIAAQTANVVSDEKGLVFPAKEGSE